VNLPTTYAAFVAETLPTVETRQGTAIRELLLNPHELIVTSLYDEISRIETENSLIDYESISADTMDRLVANLFITRRPGGRATGTVRVYFADPVTITIPQGESFSTATGYSFTAIQDTYIHESTMQLNIEGGFYYVDVPVQAAAVGDVYNVAANEVVNTTVPGAVRVNNPYAMANGVDEETNAELYVRAQNAITVRNLVNRRSVITVITDTYPSVTSVLVIGTDDAEMMRDLLSGSNLRIDNIAIGDSTYHIGGRSDVYVKTETLTETSTIVRDVKMNIALYPQPSDESPLADTTYISDTLHRPIIHIVSIVQVNDGGAVIGPALVEGTDYELIAENPDFNFSVQARNRIHFLKSSHANKHYKITYQYSSIMEIVDDYISSDDHRVVVADILTKHPLPVHLKFHLVYRAPAARTDLTTAQVISHVQDFMASLPIGDPFESSDLVDYLYNQGVTYVQLPLQISVTERLKDNTLHSFTVTDKVATSGTICVQRPTLFLDGGITAERLPD